MEKIIHSEISYKIIGICMEVHNQLGRGFLEVVSHSSETFTK